LGHITYAPTRASQDTLPMPRLTLPTLSFLPTSCRHVIYSLYGDIPTPQRTFWLWILFSVWRYSHSAEDIQATMQNVQLENLAVYTTRTSTQTLQTAEVWTKAPGKNPALSRERCTHFHNYTTPHKHCRQAEVWNKAPEHPAPAGKGATHFHNYKNLHTNTADSRSVDQSTRKEPCT